MSVKQISRNGRSCLRFLVLSGFAMGLFSFNADACPICNSDTGKEVRKSIFGPNFAQNAARALAPVPFLVGAIAAVHFGFRPRHSNQKDSL